MCGPGIFRYNGYIPLLSSEPYLDTVRWVQSATVLSLAPDVCLLLEFTIKTRPRVENVSLYLNLVFLSDEKEFPETEAAQDSPIT